MMENLPQDNQSHNFSCKLFISRFKLPFYIFGLILFLFLSYFFLISAPKDFPKETVVNIKEGSSLRSISRYLEENNIIKSRVAFETFVILFGGEKRLAFGDYYFEKKLPVFEVAKRIGEGYRNLLPVKVTIPEGFTSVDIANLFSSKLVNFNKEIFLQKVKEGYLFPDTYFFFITDNESNVLQSMSSNFDKKISPIREKIISTGKTENEIITMASIIEKESKGDSDRSLISGILWKRISIGMPLQVDAAPLTYKVKGLPANPIANPGMEAIEASIAPKLSNYLYYLHDKDGNIHFALTFEEHKLNVRKYLK